MRRGWFNLAWVVLAVSLFGCDAWKRGDAGAATVFSPNVDTTEVDGRPFVRIRSKRSAVLIDQQAARVVDFHLGRRPRWLIESDTEVEDKVRARAVGLGVSGPNVLGQAGWITPVEPVGRELELNTYWVVDGGKNRVALLSDTRDGLRFRKVFELKEITGVLEIEVALENRTSKAMRVTTISKLDALGDRQREGADERRWAGDQWFVRRFVDMQPGGDAAMFEHVTIPAHGKLVWHERWWISPGAATTQPTEPPEEPKGPGDDAKRAVP